MGLGWGGVWNDGGVSAASPLLSGCRGHCRQEALRLAPRPHPTPPPPLPGQTAGLQSVTQRNRDTEGGGQDCTPLWNEHGGLKTGQIWVEPEPPQRQRRAAASTARPTGWGSNEPANRASLLPPRRLKLHTMH